MIKNLDASGYLSVNFGELCAGLGIDETEWERIWKNFWQAGTARDRGAVAEGVPVDAVVLLGRGRQRGD